MQTVTKNLLFLFLLIQSFCGIAKTITVGQNSSITSIKKAIELAQDNDIIEVEKGTYKETDIFINKPLTLIGKNATIDGDNKGEIFIIKADDVTIQDFKIINVGTSYIKDYAAIRVRESKNFTIKNNVIADLFFGIYLEKSKNGKVLNNKIYGKAKNEFNSGNGIQLWYCNNIQIKNNYVEKVRDGIYLEFSNYCTIDNNISRDNVRYGLHFMFSNNDVVTNSSYISNGAGVAIMFSKFMTMTKNTFSHNWGSAAYGVLLKEVNDTSITYNTFKANTTAINIEGSNRVEYLHNDFISNGWAINSRGANYQNTIKNNNFLNNSFDLLYQGQLNQNSFDNNYWSNYAGYDLDKDGIGDVPHRPIKLFSYVVNKTPESIIFLRSLFVDIIDFSEKVSPVFTPDNLLDSKPFIKQIKHDNNK
ncbi:nitrous oxide reductase family maturation protein NosD [Myroides sp. M-43]|uniref:nitrous oxide reductase family maturation protein NosD n=1 Tax=Myroides oncorhynchi TaxID=2893756 RepID=UPI001E401096|nr:nitrous oxide reductase family maturation protein NosD [Myroides oncorhynchi]MCC9044235.1 nitrous oxide reductase family maturation protein NosD [Myroides oncorhynchi]